MGQIRAVHGQGKEEKDVPERKQCTPFPAL
jgi:hypothetical protein